MPDLTGAEDRAPGWYVAAATAIGRSHLAANLPCQDAAGARTLGARLVGAVSDGAGSARLSQHGSRAVVAAALDALAGVDLAYLAEAASGLAPGAGSARPTSLEPRREPGVAAVAPAATRGRAEEAGGDKTGPTCAAVVAAGRAVLGACRRALETLPGQHAAALSDFHCTLVAAAAGPGGTLAVQLGDGFLVDRCPGGEHSLVFPPQHGEYVNQTYFLTQADYLTRAQISWRPAAEFLALSSDGLERLALDCRAGSAHAPFFAYLDDWVSAPDPEVAATDELAQFLAAPPVRSKTDDDVGLVLARRVPVTAGP